MLRLPKIIFFGTPDFAAQVLEILHGSKSYEIAAVVTNPDAPSGRSQKLTPAAVKAKALALKLPVFTPEKLNAEFYQELEKIAPDLCIVFSYGKILPARFLDLPKLGTFNLHPSLLPQYRGASPVQSALLNGDQNSGFTIFRLNEKMDAGPIYVQEEIVFAEKNAREIFAEVGKKGGAALRKFCEEILSGKKFIPQMQEELQATYCRKFSKADGQIFPELESAVEILRKYRAFFLWPQVFWIDSVSKKRVKFLHLEKWNGVAPQGKELFFKTEKKCIFRTNGGYLEVVEAQPEGKNVLSGMEFWNFLR